MKQARLTAWTASTAESQSTPAQSDTDEKSGEALCERAAAHASKIAAENFPELPVETID